MEPAHRRALAAVARWLNENGIEFALGGSGLVSAMGVRIEVGDIDLVFPGDALAALEEAPWERLPPKPPFEPFHSDWLVRFVVEGVQVECIGGLRVRFGDRVVEVPVRAASDFEIDGIRVPLADPGDWALVYRAYKPERGALLADAIGGEAVAAAARRLGIDCPA